MTWHKLFGPMWRPTHSTACVYIISAFHAPSYQSTPLSHIVDRVKAGRATATGCCYLGMGGGGESDTLLQEYCYSQIEIVSCI